MNRIFLTMLLVVATLTANAHQKLVFSESFQKCVSTTIQGGYFTESLYFESATMGDHDGWFTPNCYMAERCIKFSAKTKAGYAVTPAIKFAKSEGNKVEVRFHAQNWKGDKLSVKVEVEGVDGTAQVVETADLIGISDRTQDLVTVTFDNVADGAKFRFSGVADPSGTGVTRFFLSDIRIFEECETPSNVSWATTGYLRFPDIMVSDEKPTLTMKVYSPEERPSVVFAEGATGNFFCETSETPDANNIYDLKFTFNPVNMGYKDETAIITCGANNSQNIVLVGNCKVYRPEIADASDVTTEGFTACWKPAPGMDNIELVVYTLEQAPLKSSDLMITKYIEGKSNNRAVEIFNGTGETVKLSDYSLKMESNGAGGLTACEYKFPDMELASGKTFTLCNAQYTALRDIADRTIGFQDGGYANIMTFTGDDAIGLFHGEKLVDLIGYESYDCNDRVSGDWGMDVSFYKKSSVYNPSTKFYPEEWESHEIDYAEGYGTHKMNATGEVRNIVHRLTLPGDAVEQKVEVAKDKKYYYCVRGLSNGNYTHYSLPAEVEVGNSGVSAVENETVSYTLTGDQLFINAENAEVFAIDGKKIQIKGGVADLPCKGIYIIKANNASAKVIY